MNTIIECIPNFSEGRKPDVISSIRQSIAGVSAIRILDLHSDPDHNRTVITFAGSTEAVEEAAFLGIRTASTLIDLRTHYGAHPRIGAADVVPFVPIRDATMDECVDLAHRLGKRVGAELQLPVYYYERAAYRQDRIRLEQIRAGGYESLSKAILIHPYFVPDEGPRTINAAGAVVIGARKPLIAFNIFLDTANVEYAKRIATQIRESSGGLPEVKALGMLVKGHAQVSMNLCDYTKTSISTVFSAVEELATQDHLRILNSEFVGLVPENAIRNVDLAAIKIKQDAEDFILEHRLSAT